MRFRSDAKSPHTEASDGAAQPTPQQQAIDSLQALLGDDKIPLAVRDQLKDQHRQIQALIDKLENDRIHIVAFGKVSAGKSSLLNALMDAGHFAVSPLHGETKNVAGQDWQQYDAQSVVMIDTPGIDESGGQLREEMAVEAAAHADIILFVLDGDIGQTELAHLKAVCRPNKPVLVALNKADLYTAEETRALLESIAAKTSGLIRPQHIVACSADPNPQKIIRLDADGREQVEQRTPNKDVADLKQAIWDVLESEGKTLTALNASLFAGEVSESMARKITEIRRGAANKIVRSYAIAKGLGVAFNPIPVTDLLLAAGIDVAMIRKLSSLYGLPLGRSQATGLAVTIMTQLAALMGAVWGVNLLSSALKTVSAGLSTTLTATAQASLAYYATYLVGKIAEEYFIRGQSWGERGPKKVAREILDSLDRNSILLEAREQILKAMKKK